MLQAVGVEKRYGEKLLFEGLVWQIGLKERIGLVGPNGAGKSTLLSILAGRLEPDAGSVIIPKTIRLGLLAQDLSFDFTRTVLAEVLRASEELQSLSVAIADAEQKLERDDASATEATLEEYSRLRDRFERLGGDTIEVEAKRVLGGLGFRDDQLQDPAVRFSGGWRMRIALARLLVSRPDILMLDEPTNHLDLESLAWLEGYIASYPGTVVTVSHDRTFLNRTVNRIAEIGPFGVKVYVGNYEDWLVARERERELIEKRQGEQAAEIERIERFIDRFRSKATKAAAVQSRVKQLEKIDRIEVGPVAKKMRGFRFPQPPRSGRIVAELKGVRKAYAEKVVYDGLNLAVERGQRIALVGVNGAGKSTLLKILSGVLPIEAGERVLGHNVNVGYYAQHQLDTLNPDHSVLEALAEVADIETYPMIRGILGGFLFSGDDVEKPIRVLSGGEKARVALGRLLLRPVTLLLMDEPTNHLDLDSRGSLEDALRRYEGTLVVVSHDRYFMNAVCTHVLEVDTSATSPGRPAASKVSFYLGTYDEYVAKKQAEAAADGTAISKPGTSSIAAKPGAASPDTDDERARKRREAESRQRLHSETKHLKVEVARLEANIPALEARLCGIDALLADPAVYAKGDAKGLLLERQDIIEKTEAAYARWAEIDAAIEAARARS